MDENINTERKMNKWSLLAMNIGNMVGAGVVTLVGQAIGLTGHSAWLAYAAALLLGTIYNIPVMYSTGTLKIEGGAYSLVNVFLGKKFGGMYIVSFFLYFPCVALYALALSGYINSLLPTIPIPFAAVIILTLFYILNLRGMDIMSNFQNIMSALLLVGLSTLLIMGISKTDFSNLSPIISNEGFFMNGSKGFFQATCLLMFSTYGHYEIMYFTRHSKDPKKDMPFAIKYSVIIITILYIGVTVVASGVLPIDMVANQPLTYVAQSVMPKPVFIFFMICGPLMALATTTNSVMAAYIEPIYTATKQGWFPKGLGKVNKKGAPVVLLTIEWLCATIPIILSWDLNTITNTYMLVGLATESMMLVSMMMIPKKYPNAWNSRQFMKKAPTWVFYLSVCLAFSVQIIIVINSITSVEPYIIIATIIVYVIGIIYALKKEKDNSIKLPSLDVFE